MSGYVHIRSEPGLWTVGHYHDGQFFPASDHRIEAEAIERAQELNGRARPRLGGQAMSGSEYAQLEAAAGALVNGNWRDLSLIAAVAVAWEEVQELRGPEGTTPGSPPDPQPRESAAQVMHRLGKPVADQLASWPARPWSSPTRTPATTAGSRFTATPTAGG